MALRNTQGQRGKYLTLELSRTRTPVEDMCAIVSKFQSAKIGDQCKDCGRQFVDGFEQDLVSDETRDLIERLLLERISLRGICRAVKVGLKWLLGFIANCFEGSCTSSLRCAVKHNGEM